MEPRKMSFTEMFCRYYLFLFFFYFWGQINPKCKDSKGNKIKTGKVRQKRLEKSHICGIFLEKSDKM